MSLCPSKVILQGGHNVSSPLCKNCGSAFIIRAENTENTCYTTYMCRTITFYYTFYSTWQALSVQWIRLGSTIVIRENNFVPCSMGHFQSICGVIRLKASLTSHGYVHSIWKREKGNKLTLHIKAMSILTRVNKTLWPPCKRFLLLKNNKKMIPLWGYWSWNKIYWEQKYVSIYKNSSFKSLPFSERSVIWSLM